MKPLPYYDCVHSQVYTDTFRNKPYSMSMREDIAVITPDVREHYSEYIPESIRRQKERIKREKEAAEK